MIPEEQDIKDWYGKLCAEARQMELKKLETLCVHCKRPCKEHYHQKCDNYVTSFSYRAANKDQVEKTAAIITAVEQLAAICGWNLF